MFILLDIALLLIHAALIGGCVYALRKITKESMYSYKVISFLGGIIFLSVGFLHHVIRLITWPSDIPFDLYQFTSLIIGSFTFFAMLTSFLMVPFAVFLIISNIILVKKEGTSLPNLLGVLLSIAIIAGITAVVFSYDVLDQFMNVHSYAGYCFSLWFENLFAIVLSYLECIAIATVYVSIKSARHIPRRDKDYMIILGCRTRDDGKPAGLLRARIDRALEFSKLQKKESNKPLVFVPSGGKGKDEPISEAVSIKNYLESKKVLQKSILVESDSKTTRENFHFSKLKMKTTADVAFATSDFHVFRAGVIATKAGFKNIEGIGARTPWFYHNNALIREMIANLNSEKSLHLKNLVLIIVSLTILILLCYFFDLL